jgi:hypothetical protein
VRLKKIVWSVLVAAGLVVLYQAPALAQCAMCRAAFDGANGAKLAKSLNEGIIVLLIPAVMIFCGIFITAIRFRKAPDDRS